DDNMVVAEEIMQAERIRHLVVVDGEVLLGLVSYADILTASISALANPSDEEDLDFKRHMPVSEIMSGSVETIGPDADVTEAADLMLTQRTDCLPVVDERHRIAGIVTALDFVRVIRRMLRDVAAGGARPAQPARPTSSQRSATTSMRGPAVTKTSSARR